MFGSFCSGLMGVHGIGGFFASLILISVAVIALVVLFNGRQSNGKPSDGAMNELRLRFVRGEITREEFERIKASL